MPETPLTAIRAARSIERLPDGSPMTSPMAHTLIVLASYWPNVWPSQARLAADMKVQRASVNKRLKLLEDAGLIHRLHRGRNRSTLYRLDLETIRACIPEDTSHCIHREPLDVSLRTQEDQYKSYEGDAATDVDPDADWIPF